MKTHRKQTRKKQGGGSEFDGSTKSTKNNNNGTLKVKGEAVGQFVPEIHFLINLLQCHVTNGPREQDGVTRPFPFRLISVGAHESDSK